MQWQISLGGLAGSVGLILFWGFFIGCRDIQASNIKKKISSTPTATKANTNCCALESTNEFGRQTQTYNVIDNDSRRSQYQVNSFLLQPASLPTISLLMMALWDLHPVPPYGAKHCSYPNWCCNKNQGRKYVVHYANICSIPSGEGFICYLKFPWAGCLCLACFDSLQLPTIEAWPPHKVQG